MYNTLRSACAIVVSSSAIVVANVFFFFHSFVFNTKVATANVSQWSRTETRPERTAVATTHVDGPGNLIEIRFAKKKLRFSQTFGFFDDRAQSVVAVYVSKSS